MMLAIEAKELSKSFQTRGRKRRLRTVEAVRDVSFSVEEGERLAYIGPNGAGKSTSIKMLTGILHPTAGHANVLGFVPWKQRMSLARHIGTLFGQRSQLWAELPPRDGFQLLAAIYRIESDEARRRIDELSDVLDAEDLFDTPVRNLSLGQRMRCELAASMLHRPKVLFLDEPTIGLDLVAKQNFRSMIVRLNETQGTTIFLTSHDVADIEQVARRVIVINHGIVIFDDKVSRLRRSLLATKLIEVRFDSPPAALVFDGVQVVKQSGTGYKLVVDTERRSIREVLDELLDHHRVADISVADPPLEDVIAKIYRERL
ncbi:MAG: ATP-binding cassette domain-containing protein [Actinomycetota bacterium]|nr:ATP-binding cassette domain-containing protein [Actinomycetota bacterium]